jgi:hypothetical protein
MEDAITFVGMQVFTSNDVDAATLFWGIPKSHRVFITRSGTEAERLPAVQNDGTDV